MPACADATTPGWLLDGRVAYRQLAGGHRSGIEPVFLAASVPARPGERVLEGGTGAGAALLCLACRVPGILGIGVELDPALAAVAAANFAALDPVGLKALAGDLRRLPFGHGTYHHAFANPPWHDWAGTPSPDPARERARRASPGTVADWTAALAGYLAHRGTLTLIGATAGLPEFLAALPAAGLGSACSWPLWPRAGQPAKLTLMRAVRGGRAPFRLLPGLVLHAADGSFTARASDVLRGGAALSLTADHVAA